ncbi:hypothetical protein [Streptomyces sp. NPDC047718]|uniref:hypothetical protein n=1 Tax=Streptomyces sp. NPDC047718 TaxID=3155479 RepID=UPI0033CFA295
MIPSTRRVELVNTMDAELVAAFGTDPQAALIYVSDRVDKTRVSQWETDKS